MNFNKITDWLETEQITINKKYLHYKCKKISVLLRKSKRIFAGKIYRCVDIVSVEVVEMHQSKGLYKKFEHQLINLIKNYNFNLYVECVNNERFKNYFYQRKEFFLVNPEPTPCFLYILKLENREIARQFASSGVLPSLFTKIGIQLSPDTD